MAQYPALPIWTDALLGDTTHLSAAEFGAYMLMLIVAWRTPDCCLPNDPVYLARITRSEKSWGRMRKVVMPFWTLGADGNLRQKRLTQTRLAAAKNVDHARKAWEASALKRKGTARARAPSGHEPEEDLGSGNHNLKKERVLSSSLPTDAEVALNAAADQRLTAGDFAQIQHALGNPPALLNLGRVGTWLRSGADLQLDILPTLAAVLKRQRQRDPGWTPSTLTYFDQPVADALARRIAPQPAGNGAKAPGAPRRRLSIAEQVALRKKWGLENAPRSVVLARAAVEGMADIYPAGDD